MKRKADPDRIVEARAPTRLSEVVARRERKEVTARKKHSASRARERTHPSEATDTPSFRRHARTQEDRADGHQEEQAARKEGEKKSRRNQKWTPMARAVAMLARREHSKVELVSKLVARGVDKQEAERVVQELEELDLQSDQRFLESKVRQRVGNGYGPRRTQMELSNQGLDEAAVDKALEEPGDEWIQGAYDLIERRYGESPLPFELRQKALGLLVRRGFSFDQAQQVIREPRPDPNEN